MELHHASHHDPTEEQGKNDEKFNIYDKENEKKILELYHNFVQIQLENQRKEELKHQAEQVVKKLDPTR